MLGFHQALLGLDEEMLRKVYFSWLANFKLAALLLSFTPWLALQLMSG